ncbi:hypothetical protein K456DRAFT_47327 [Colletotrichum gloeosporioides 23]|nr:hypothetical protein K456DRAFT_47327 [Colletotrichum gloeosporioides 23]
MSAAGVGILCLFASCNHRSLSLLARHPEKKEHCCSGPPRAPKVPKLPNSSRWIGSPATPTHSVHSNPGLFAAHHGHLRHLTTARQLGQGTSSHATDDTPTPRTVSTSP